MTSPFIPSSFTYGDAPQGGAVMPMVVAGRDPSDTIDRQYDAGYLWLSAINLGGSGLLFYQAGNQAGTPTWTVSSSAAGALNTLSDGSTVVLPSGGNIALGGTTNQITTTSSGPAHEIVFSIPNTFIAPGSIASTTTLTAGTDLAVNNDAAITNDLTVGGNATITGALTAGSITFTGLDVNGTVTINTVGAGTTTIGNAAAGAIVVDVGTGDFTMNGGGNEIHIGDDAVANLITIGSITGVGALTLQAGAGDIKLQGAVTTAYTVGTLTGTGLITLGFSTAGQDIDIGSGINTVAQTIDIGNGASGANSTVRILSGTGTAGAATLALGNNPRVTVAGMTDVAPAASRTTTIGGGTVVVAAVTDTIDIGPDGATTNANSIKTVNINTGGVTTGQVLTNIATGTVTSGTHTTSIATGNRAAGTMAVNLLTGTGTKTLSVGNADGLTTTTFLGPHNINANQNNNTAINSGTSTGTVTIGNAAAGAITVDTAAGISLAAATLSDFTVTGAGQDLNLMSVGGSILVEATENAALAIRLHANGGTTETIQIHADQGTSTTSIDVLSDVGGVSVRGGLATANAVVLNSTNAAGGITLTAGTAGVNVAGNLNLTSVATQITMNGGAVTDFIGTATLIGGQATVLNTNIAAGDRIMITRSALNASPALGFLLYTINAGVSFVVDSLSAAGAAVATDVSSFTYVIFRQT